MNKTEIKTEIQKVLDSVPESVLQSVLDYLKSITQAKEAKFKTAEHLRKILEEDAELLQKLAE